MLEFYMASLLLLILMIPESSAKDSPTPLNDAVLKGSLVRLKCSVGSNSRWMFSAYTSKNSEPKQICTMRRGCGNANYSLGRTNNITSILIINTSSSSYSFAGTYSCESPSKEDKGSAELIVLENDPKCDFNVTYDSSEALEPNGTKLMAWCKISFRGRWAPVVEWRLGDVNGPIVQTGITNITIADQSVTSTLTVLLNGSSGRFQYSVTTKFVESMTPDSPTAKNIPDYNYTWICCRENEITSTSSRNDPQTTEPIEEPRGATPGQGHFVVGLIVSTTIASVVFIVCIVCMRLFGRCCFRKSVVNHLQTEPDLIDPIRLPRTPISDDYSNEYIEPSPTNVPTSGGRTHNRRLPQPVGEDGTVYAQVNSGRLDAGNSQPRAPPRLTSPVRTNGDIYASIDHTVIPEVPPRINRTRRME